MTDLRASLAQALLIQANLQNELRTAQDTQEISQQTIDKLQTSLTQSSLLCKELQDKIDLQSKNIDNIGKDVKSMQNENTLLKWGIGAAILVGVGGIIYGLAK